MAFQYIQQTSFGGGELSPDMWARRDMAKFAVGAKQLLNFYVTLTGAIQNRQGTEMIATAAFPTNLVRIIPFQFSTVQAYILEFGLNIMRVFRDNNDGTAGIVLSGGVPFTLATPYADTEVFNLKFTQSADTMFITHGNHLPQMLTRTADNAWTITPFTAKYGPFMTPNSSTTTITPTGTLTVGGTATLTASASIFQAGHVGSLWRIAHEMSGPEAQGSFTTATSSVVIQTNTEWTLTTHGTWQGTLKLSISYDAGVTWQVIRSYTSHSDTNIVDSDTIDVNNIVLGNVPQLRLDMSGTVTGTCNYDLVGFPYEVYGIVKITGYTSGTVVTGTVQSQIGNTTATPLWAEGSWSAVRGYPSVCVFFQNRLLFAATSAEPNTIWDSQPSDYTNFAKSFPSQDSDSLTAPLVSEQVNAIHSLSAMRDTLAFTDSCEWLYTTGSSGAAITPTNQMYQPQTYWGSNTLDPINVGLRTLFVQRMGASVRDTWYQWSFGIYSGDDLTLLSRHLFENHEIVSWAYQQTPHSIVWVVRDDGVLLSFTYQKDQEMWAWSRHETDGYFESVAVIPSPTTNRYEPWFVVNRTINGQTVRFIERLSVRMASTDPAAQNFLDCSSYYNGSPMAITAISNSNPCQITCPGHGYANGQLIGIDSVVWTPKKDKFNNSIEQQYLNWGQFLVTVVDANTIALSDPQGNPVDATGFTAYLGGGCCRQTTTSVSGLSYLQGKTVGILADGSVLAQQVVPASGTISIQEPASRLVIGLPYNCDAELLDVQFQLQDGVVEGRKKVVSQAMIRYENSLSGYVGQDNFSMVPTPPQSPTMYGVPEQLYTGSILYSGVGSFDVDGGLFIRQIDPLPMTILSVVRGVDFGGT